MAKSISSSGYTNVYLCPQIIHNRGDKNVNRKLKHGADKIQCQSHRNFDPPSTGSAYHIPMISDKGH